MFVPFSQFLKFQFAEPTTLGRSVKATPQFVEENAFPLSFH
jgi:hypothetical protein